MANEVNLRYPNGTPPATIAHPKFAVYAGFLQWNGSAFVAQSDATAWQSGCFFSLSAIFLNNGTTFTGDYTANMPAGIDLTQTYNIRMYNAAGTPTVGTELGPTQIWNPAASSSTPGNVTISDTNVTISDT